MADSNIVRNYHVVKVGRGERPFHVLWRDSEIVDGVSYWKDGGFISAHRVEALAQKKAGDLNATVPLTPEVLALLNKAAESVRGRISELEQKLISRLTINGIGGDHVTER